MILSSMKVYDDVTIKKWVQSERYYDPLTGIPMSVAGWPLLLQPRQDIQRKIDRFLRTYPSFKSSVFDEADDTIHWDELFKKYEEKIKDKYTRIVAEQSELKTKAKQIFKPMDMGMPQNGGDDFVVIKEKKKDKDEEKKKNDEDHNVGIFYDDSIILQPDIPVVCIMGPSRKGKSTIVNDILGVKNACKISLSSNVAYTKGGWIALYTTAPDVHQEHNPTDDNEEREDFKEEGVEFISKNECLYCISETFPFLIR